MTVSQFYKKTFNTLNSDSKYENDQTEILIDEKYLIRVIRYLKLIEDINAREIHFKDLISKPNMNNGKLHEYLVYDWLQTNHIKFKEQLSISADECLKKNKYLADGCFDDIVFDIKKFGIGLPLYDNFKQSLQKIMPNHYFITVEGNLNLDVNDLNKHFISKVQDWKEKLLSPSSKLGDDYAITESKYGITIRAHNIKNSGGISTSISEIDITQWAQNNEMYFFRHASQFCCNKPYIIFCPFFPRDFHFASNDETFIYYAFRFLCRRMFMNLTKKSDQFLSVFDGHAKDNITLQTAAKKLSGVIFLDISDEWEYSNCRCWVYKNPNADFLIPISIIDSRFRVLGAYIDDFKYDNY